MSSTTKKSRSAHTTTERWVVVTTTARGVFFGRTAAALGADPIVLDDAQMCITWSADVRGVLGLAATGPTATCRVTAATPSIELRGISAVIDCTPEAVAAWQATPWR